MRLKILLIINAVIGVLYGIAMLLFTAWGASLYGVTATPALILLARLLGAYMLGMGMLSWFIRNALASNTQVYILYAFFAIHVLGFVISLISVLEGTVNALGWSSVALYFLIAVGFAYFLFFKPRID